MYLNIDNGYEDYFSKIFLRREAVIAASLKPYMEDASFASESIDKDERTVINECSNTQAGKSSAIED